MKKCIALQKQNLTKHPTPTANCTGNKCKLQTNDDNSLYKMRNSFANTKSFLTIPN